MHTAKASLTAFMLLAYAVTAAAPSNAGTTGVLTGYVFDSYGRMPQANAVVEIATCLDWMAYEWSCTTVDQRQTDSHGRYLFVSLNPGYYFVHAHIANTRIGSPCRTKAAVDADLTTFVDLSMNDFSKGIYDCFRIVHFRPTVTSSNYSFGADGDLEH